MAADPRLRPAGRHFRQPRRVRKRLVALFSAVALVIAAIVGVAAVRSVPFSGTAVPVPAAIQETPVAVAPAVAGPGRNGRVEPYTLEPTNEASDQRPS